MRATALSAGLALAMLGGCATAPSLGTIARGDSVAITVTTPVPATGAAVPIVNTSLGKDASTGSQVGMLAGSLWGLACGPLFVICSPFGAMVLAVPGAAAGAVVGLSGALTEAQATQLRDRTARMRQSHDLQAELRSEIAQRASRYWTTDTGKAEPAAQPPHMAVAVELLGLGFTSAREGQIGLVMQFRASVRETGAEAVRTKTYAVASPVSALAVWLDESSDFFDVSLRSALQQVASQIVAELAPS